MIECNHTEHAIGSLGRMGRSFPDSNTNPAGYWEPCPNQEWPVHGALARACAIIADDPDWMNVTRWPRA